MPHHQMQESTPAAGVIFPMVSAWVHKTVHIRSNAFEHSKCTIYDMHKHFCAHTMYTCSHINTWIQLITFVFITTLCNYYVQPVLLVAKPIYVLSGEWLLMLCVHNNVVRQRMFGISLAALNSFCLRTEAFWTTCTLSLGLYRSVPYYLESNPAR